jgi:transposase
VRVTTALNRMLGLPGAWVRDVEFSERAVIVTVALRRKQPVCSGCRARGRARYTRDFDDLTAWLAQQMSQTQVTRLMRIGWETVGNILARVVAEKLPGGRLDGLELIGVDEVSYGADHKFLTCVADHEGGGIVWATEGRNAATSTTGTAAPPAARASGSRASATAS